MTGAPWRLSAAGNAQVQELLHSALLLKVRSRLLPRYPLQDSPLPRAQAATDGEAGHISAADVSDVALVRWLVLAAVLACGLSSPALTAQLVLVVVLFASLQAFLSPGEYSAHSAPVPPAAAAGTGRASKRA